MVRALVISDAHFGAWTGEDLLRQPEKLALLEPHLDVDEVIFLGDLFDFLFGEAKDCLAAAGGLFDLLRERLQGKRFVFTEGNHDHDLVTRDAETLVELELTLAGSSQRAGDALQRAASFRRFLQARFEGVEVDIRYPTYTFGDVLCTHGHYLDVHARQHGAAPDQLLGRVIWSIAVGADHAPTLADYEATTTLLTGVLFTIAQLPNGTTAQQRVYKGFQTLQRAIAVSHSPREALESIADRARPRTGDQLRMLEKAYGDARERERERLRRVGAPAGGEATSFALARRVRPSDPLERAVEAFEDVLTTLGWAKDTDKIVFAHTHQPLDGVTGPSGRWRYWNTGSWIYEPDLSSKRAYAAYVRNAWPGTAVVIDTDEPHPRLLRLIEQPSPSNGDPGDPGDPEPKPQAAL
jgi:UDP-2,3-diacylglucosamine pyrophosphatase LpxH